MEVRVLGPLEVADEFGRIVSLRAKERVLLCRLAAARSATVSIDALSSSLWHDHAPPSAHKTLQGLVYHLRRVFGPDAIARDPHGYRLVGVGTDHDRVEQLVAEARRCAASLQHSDARRLLRTAHSTVRGPAYIELEDDPAMIGFRRSVDEFLLTATEELFELELAPGGHPNLVAELEKLAAQDPTRERVWYLLVSALAAGGRHADALHAIGRARRALSLELGIEPGPQLLALELAVLEHRVTAAETPSIRVAASAPLPGPLGAWSDAAPFVGRAHEITLLEEAHRVAIGNARPHLDLIIGEAGIGKTRLAAAFAGSCHRDGTLVLFGRCSEFVGTAFEPFQQALDRLVDMSPAAVGDDAAVQRVHSLLHRLSADPWSTVDRTPEAARHQLLDEVAAVLAMLARDRTVLLVLDDIHWAALPTVMAVLRILQRADRARLHVLATARAPEYGGTDVLGLLGVEPGARICRLHGLSVSDVNSYLELLASPLRGATSAEALVARTGGNAFLVAELANASDAEGAVGHDVPEVVTDAILTRARRLPPAALTLLQIAAVAGLEFDLTWMVEASGFTEAEAVGAFDAAVSAQLVFEQSSRRVVYAFTHAMTRDALIAGLTNAKRTMIHRQLAEGLERSTAARSPAVVGRLAYHYLRCTGADALAAGCHYAERAGESAAAAFAYDDAIDWFAEAIDTGRDLPPDLALTSRLHLALARAATLAGDQPTARGAAEQAWRIARESGDRATEVAAVLLYAGEPELNVVGNEPGTIMLAATLDQSGLAAGDRVRVMARLSSALSYVDHDHAVRLALGALDLARAGSAPSDLAYAIRCRLRGWFDPDRFDERLAMTRELIDIGASDGGGVAESWGWRWQSITRFEVGDAAGIETSCRRLGTLAERLHLPNQQWSSAFRLAALRVFQGRFTDADALLEEAHASSQHIDNALTASLEFVVRDTLDWLRGRPARALDPGNQWDTGLWWQRDDAGRILGDVANDPVAFFGVDIDRLASILEVALTLRVVPHRGAAEAAEPWATRFEHLVAVMHPGAMMFGSMHLYAGIIAMAAGHRAAAVDHFRSAVEANTSLGAAPYVAFAQHELAHALPRGNEASRLKVESKRLAEHVGIPWLMT